MSLFARGLHKLPGSCARTESEENDERRDSRFGTAGDTACSNATARPGAATTAAGTGTCSGPPVTSGPTWMGMAAHVAAALGYIDGR